MVIRDESPDRRHHRMNQDIPVLWRISEHELRGQGIIINVSESGVLLQIDHLYGQIKVGDKIRLETVNPDDMVLVPSFGIVRWHKITNDKFRAGLEFDEPDANIIENIRSAVKNFLNSVAQSANANIINKIFPHRDNRGE